MKRKLDKEISKRIYDENYRQKVDSWSDNNIKFTDRIIRRVNRFLTKQGFVIQHDMKSLDVGCAKGHFTESLRKSGFDSYGFDISETAIKLAEATFPHCHFFVHDGYEPELQDKYSLVFMKGFSGTNTHDLDFVKVMCNRYIDSLLPDGWLIVAYSTDFSGVEKGNETANWSRGEILTVGRSLKDVDLIAIRYFSHSKFWLIVRSMMNIVGIRRKTFFYLFFKKRRG
jgi:hypothetical protein